MTDSAYKPTIDKMLTDAKLARVAYSKGRKAARANYPRVAPKDLDEEMAVWWITGYNTTPHEDDL